MKKLFTIISLLLACDGYTQNVGINTPTPQYPLDVNGRMRLRSLSNSTPGIWYNSLDNASPLHFVGNVNDSVFGIWNNNIGWRFYFDSKNNNLGIGNATPQYPISFSSTIGDKISLWSATPSVPKSNHYGIGVQASQLQLFTPTSGDDVVIGYGSSENFTESVRIKGNGKMGINNPNPSAQLDVAGTVKIADGTQGANKVLTSDASGNASWQSLGSSMGYKKCKMFSSAGTTTWTMPSGVTEIMVEAWGAGGGPVCNSNEIYFRRCLGGASGGYCRTTQNLPAGTVLSVTIGAGGGPGDGVTTSPESGGSTQVQFLSGKTIVAYGGNGYLQNSAGLPTPGGGYGTVDNYLALNGNNGNAPYSEFGQKSSTVFTETRYCGDGGRPVGLLNSYINKSQILYYENGVLKNYISDSFGNTPSAGGAAINTSAGASYNKGGDGMVIIWYN